MTKTALITGVAGQDGSLLSKFLLDKGYSVYGINKPRTSLENHKKIGISGRVSIIDGDITDASSVAMALMVSKPDEIYSLAAQSHVGYSFKAPQITCSTNFLGHLNIIMEARRHAPYARIYHASTSEQFGYSAILLQNEDTPFQPMSPYAVSKVAAHWCGVNARYEANQFVSNGILFNHESPLRHPDFVTKKITLGVNAIRAREEAPPISLGNIDSQRDWGYAGDYVEAMWMMLQHDKPDDFVVATGRTHSVRDFVRMAFEAAGMEIRFEGEGINEKGFVGNRIVMRIDERFYRPNELSFLRGDYSKIASVLGWQPKVRLPQLVNMMVNE